MIRLEITFMLRNSVKIKTLFRRSLELNIFYSMNVSI